MTRSLSGLLFFVVVALVISGESTTLYLSTSGVDTTECSKNDPCADLNTLLTVFGNSTDELVIDVEDGIYSGANNYNVQFPDVPVTVRAADNNVTFTCGDSTLHTCFIASNEFTLDTIIINQCQLGILFSGTEFAASSSSFTYLTSGISVTNATSFVIDDCTFETCAGAMELSSFVNLTALEISNTNLWTSGPASFNLLVDNDIEATIDTISIDQSISAFAFQIVNGNWKLTDVTGESSSSIVNFSGSGNYTRLEVENMNVMSSDGAIYFNALAPLEIKESSFNVTDSAIEIDSATTIEVKDSYFYYAQSPLSIEIFQTVLIEIENCEFDFTGAAAIDVASSSNGTISDCSFKDSVFPMRINGGMWGISNTHFYNDADNMANVIQGDGGALMLAGADSSFDISSCTFEEISAAGNGGAVYSTDAAVAFTSCTFEENYSGGYGGAVYVTEPAALSISDCTFTSNNATSNGGGIAIESDSTLEVYMDNVSFNNNEAINGAAASCCANSVGSCNVTLVYSSEKSVSLSNNVNTNGGDTSNDVTCTTTIGDFQTAATDPEVDISSSGGLEWWAWILICLAVIVFLGIIIVVGVAVVWKLKMSKTPDYAVVE